MAMSEAVTSFNFLLFQRRLYYGRRFALLPISLLSINCERQMLEHAL